MSSPSDRDLHDIRTLLNAGHLAEAERAAVALTRAFPQAAPAFNILGAVQATAGTSGAETNFRKAIALAPAWDEPHSNLGLLHCQRRDFATAAQHLRAALKLKPGNVGAAIHLGNALRELRAYDEAVSVYHQALAGGADEALVTTYLGAVLLDKGLEDEAISYFERAITLRPTQTLAYLALARAQRRRGLFAEALSIVEKASEIEPTSSEAAILLGHTLGDLGRTADAIQSYRRALKFTPSDREAAHNLGLALNKLGQHGEGLEAIRRGPGAIQMKLAPDSNAPLGSAAERRISVSSGPLPSFIGGWRIEHPELCDQLISFFENRAADHSNGRSLLGVDTAVKRSTDLGISPADLDRQELAPVKAYLTELEACLGDYAQQWPFLGAMLNHVDIGPFNIQRYSAGGHFQKIHTERTAFSYMHRVLAWMTYLNDVEDGGETTFHHFGLSVRPERGKTLIWPAEWTHAHSGGVVTAGMKYIITGWMHFPHRS